jgi:hypothetical protein
MKIRTKLCGQNSELCVVLFKEGGKSAGIEPLQCLFLRFINCSRTLIWIEAANKEVLLCSELLKVTRSNRTLKLYLVCVDSLAISCTIFCSEVYLRYYRLFWYAGSSHSSMKSNSDRTTWQYLMYSFISTRPCFYGFLKASWFFHQKQIHVILYS